MFSGGRGGGGFSRGGGSGGGGGGRGGFGGGSRDRGDFNRRGQLKSQKGPPIFFFPDNIKALFEPRKQVTPIPAGEVERRDKGAPSTLTGLANLLHPQHAPQEDEEEELHTTDIQKDKVTETATSSAETPMTEAAAEATTTTTTTTTTTQELLPPRISLDTNTQEAGRHFIPTTIAFPLLATYSSSSSSSSSWSLSSTLPLPKFSRTSLSQSADGAAAQARLERREQRARLKQQQIEEAMSKWDPHSDPNATNDAFRTLFVARLDYSTTEDSLRKEFEQFGPIESIRIVREPFVVAPPPVVATKGSGSSSSKASTKGGTKGGKGTGSSAVTIPKTNAVSASTTTTSSSIGGSESGKSRGYAFIEFESEADVKTAFRLANGASIDGRKIICDVERGRTVRGWLPRKFGGGLGGQSRDPLPKKRIDPALSRIYPPVGAFAVLAPSSLQRVTAKEAAIERSKAVASARVAAARQVVAVVNTGPAPGGIIGSGSGGSGSSVAVFTAAPPRMASGGESHHHVGGRRSDDVGVFDEAEDRERRRRRRRSSSRDNDDDRGGRYTSREYDDKRGGRGGGGGGSRRSRSRSRSPPAEDRYRERRRNSRSRERGERERSDQYKDREGYRDRDRERERRRSRSRERY